MKGGHHIALTVPPRRTKTRYPGVYASSSGNYEISYSDSNGRRIFKALPKGTKLKEAVQIRADILGRMGKGEKVIRTRMTVAQLAEEYMATQTGHLKASTVKTYDDSLRVYVIPRLGNVRLSELTVGHIAEFITDMRKPRKVKGKTLPGYKKWTINGCLGPMSSMFRYAVRKGLMARNPIRDLDRNERPKADNKPIEVLSSEEIGALLRVSQKSSYLLLFQTAIFTGLRRGELLALEWSDIDYDQGLIRVREGKTAAASREVVIPDWLKRQIAAQDKLEGKVFPFQKRNVNRALTNALKKAGLKHVRFHDLRHTYASVLISSGATVVYVSQQMGHANPAITLKVYAQLWDSAGKKEEMREKLNAFAEILG